MYLCVPRGRTGACRSRAMLMKCPACVCSWIADTQLSGSIPSSLGNLTQLMYLCVPRERRSRCAVPACSAKALCLCSQLSLQQHAQRYRSVQHRQSHYLDGSVRPSAPASWMDARCDRTTLMCHACVRSGLHNNELSGSIPSSLGNLTQLLYLCVPRERRSRCAVPACSAKALCLCSQLSLQQHAQRYRSVQHRQSHYLDGSVRPSAPASWMDARCDRTTLMCHACVRSELNNNELSGSIPSSLGSLTALTYLCVPLAGGNNWT